MIDKLEILFWRLAIWIIRKGYGADCRESDIDDFPENKEELLKDPKGRCGSCRAKEAIEWIEDHIELIKL